jgi:hypothetical protein
MYTLHGVADEQCLDPTFEDTKKQCITLRRQARDERTVFYYNGHGVPKPTSSGEIWVFNKSEPMSRSVGGAIAD